MFLFFFTYIFFGGGCSLVFVFSLAFFPPLFHSLFLCLSLVLFFLPSFFSLFLLSFASLFLSLCFFALFLCFCFMKEQHKIFNYKVFFIKPFCLLVSCLALSFKSLFSCFPYLKLCFVNINGFVFQERTLIKHQFSAKLGVATKHSFITCVWQNVKSFFVVRPIFGQHLVDVKKHCKYKEFQNIVKSKKRQNNSLFEGLLSGPSRGYDLGQVKMSGCKHHQDTLGHDMKRAKINISFPSFLPHAAPKARVITNCNIFLQGFNFCLWKLQTLSRQRWKETMKHNHQENKWQNTQTKKAKMNDKIAKNKRTPKNTGDKIANKT